MDKLSEVIKLKDYDRETVRAAAEERGISVRDLLEELDVVDVWVHVMSKEMKELKK